MSPLRKFFSTRSASVPFSPRLNAFTSMNMGSSSHSPVVGFFFELLVANPKAAILPPVLKTRISGSRVSRPIRITLFTFAMGHVSTGCLLGALDSHRLLFPIVYKRPPVRRKVGSVPGEEKPLLLASWVIGSCHGEPAAALFFRHF